MSSLFAKNIVDYDEHKAFLLLQLLQKRASSIITDQALQAAGTTIYGIVSAYHTMWSYGFYLPTLITVFQEQSCEGIAPPAIYLQFAAQIIEIWIALEAESSSWMLPVIGAAQCLTLICALWTFGSDGRDESDVNGTFPSAGEATFLIPLLCSALVIMNCRNQPFIISIAILLLHSLSPMGQIAHWWQHKRVSVVKKTSSQTDSKVPFKSTPSANSRDPTNYVPYECTLSTITLGYSAYTAIINAIWFWVSKEKNVALAVLWLVLPGFLNLYALRFLFQCQWEEWTYSKTQKGNEDKHKHEDKKTK